MTSGLRWLRYIGKILLVVLLFRLVWFLAYRDGNADPLFAAKWRLPMGESGILNSFLAILASGGVQQPLMIHVLRLIGNSCADTGNAILFAFEIDKLISD
jgi:hypothetical protein